MTPQSILRELANRFGLTAADGERLLPLIERALQAPDEVRDRVLELVEKNLAREARRRAEKRALAVDEHMLSVVAKVLHPWIPPDWLMRWTSGDAAGRPELGGAAEAEAG